MAKYLFLASGGRMPASKEEGAKMMKTWEDWFAAMGRRVVDPGSPLSPVGKIAADGSVSDVPAGAMVNGYMIVEGRIAGGKLSRQDRARLPPPSY